MNLYQHTMETVSRQLIEYTTSLHPPLVNIIASYIQNVQSKKVFYLVYHQIRYYYSEGYITLNGIYQKKSAAKLYVRERMDEFKDLAENGYFRSNGSRYPSTIYLEIRKIDFDVWFSYLTEPSKIYSLSWKMPDKYKIHGHDDY